MSQIKSTKRLTKDVINNLAFLMNQKKFSSGKLQNCLVFIPAKEYIKYFSGTTGTDSWKSNGLLEENTEIITKSDSNFASTFVDHQVLPHINFNGHYFYP